ncbi:hypothetical protein [Lapillicoccus sp.]|uniref:hypothetical protein n=1 Tax=Lapillicoccus sp. TaxID=1909287 RepID=UPI0025D2FCA1|nr:hypothetical protein [Lapillicoccus sp.]
MRHGDGGRGSAQVQVFIRDGLVRWHATRSCGERDAREGDFAYRCPLDAAYRSPLVPCPACAGELTVLAGALWGPTTSHDRVRLPIPRLLPLTNEPDSAAARDDDLVLVNGGARRRH